MKLSQFIKDLQELEAQGHGDKPIVSCQSASGAYDPIGSAHVSDHFGDMGPFDIPEGTQYIEITVGH